MSIDLDKLTQAPLVCPHCLRDVVVDWPVGTIGACPDCGWLLTLRPVREVEPGYCEFCPSSAGATCRVCGAVR